MGYTHHLNVVSVRKDKYSVSVIPVGQVIDPKKFTPEYLSKVDQMRSISPKLTSEPLKVSLNGSVAGLVSLEINNPSQIKLEASLELEDKTGDWVVFPDHTHVTVEPNSVKEIQFALARDSGSKLSLPQFVYSSEAITKEARFTLPPKRLKISVEAQSVSDSYFKGVSNGKLLLNR